MIKAVTVYVSSDGHHGEQQKSSSFISTNTEDNDKMMQSSVSIGGHTLGVHTEDGDDGQGECPAI